MSPGQIGGRGQARPYSAAYHAEPDIPSSQVGAALVAARAPG